MLDKKKLEDWIDINERVLMDLKGEKLEDDQSFYGGCLSVVKKLKMELASGSLDANDK